MGNSVSFIAFGGCAGSPVRARSMLLALVCAASTYIGAGIPFAAAQSAGIEELVNEHGVTPTFELHRRSAAQFIRNFTKRGASLRPACSLHVWGPTYRR